MRKNIFWNQTEKRLRAGWRILIQILITSVPLTLLGLSGFYLQGNLALRMSLTALPITVLSVIIVSRWIDKRKLTDLGIKLGEKVWWRDYGFGILAGVLSASTLTLLLRIFGWARVLPSNQWRTDLASFIGSLLVALLSYLGVGIFEELMRAYQVRNVVEGLGGSKLGLSGAAILAVLLGGSWSVLAHISRPDPSFLVYVLVTGLIYGLFFLWTKRAALAMAIHFAWDFTNSSIFQLGSTSETSLFFVRLKNIPDLGFDMMTLLGIIAKVFVLLLVLWWIQRKEGKIEVKAGLEVPTLLEKMSSSSN